MQYHAWLKWALKQHAYSSQNNDGGSPLEMVDTNDKQPYLYKWSVWKCRYPEIQITIW